jgi:hypothetical protein
MERVGIHRKEREPGIVVLRDRTTWKMVVDIANGEVLKMATLLVRVTLSGGRFGHAQFP